MADFDPPFAWDGDRRVPTPDEIDRGFPCGPADQQLFNWLIWSLQGEIGEVVDFAGITPTNDNNTTLRQAIEALIAAATGGGDTSQFLLVSQARARLPIFPEILTADGKMGVTSTGVGNVRIPAGVNFSHRGIFPIATVQTDLVTDASKTYHLRWNPTDGFTLKDLAAPAYNPTAAAETNTAFDSVYDDMLIARVITNSSNSPTITNLVNLNRLMIHTSQNAPMLEPSTNNARGQFNVPLNWARAPKLKNFVVANYSFNDTAASAPGTNVDVDIQMWQTGGYPTLAIFEIPATRYASAFDYQMDYAANIVLAFNFEA